jgi:hypothetical protein
LFAKNGSGRKSEWFRSTFSEALSWSLLHDSQIWPSARNVPFGITLLERCCDCNTFWRLWTDISKDGYSRVSVGKLTNNIRHFEVHLGGKQSQRVIIEIASNAVSVAQSPIEQR